MKRNGAKQQTFFLTGVNGVVRALGLAMRVWMSRLLGAETIGVIELAQSVHMVAIAPLTSGLPVAISRLTAKADHQNKEKALEAGLWLARTFSSVLVPLMWLLAPLIARWMGDFRVLPSLWFTAPCILILGYSASYNGYCYGMERSELPAQSELLEQVFRFVTTITLLHLLNRLTTPWLAAIPVAATMMAEIAGLVYVLRKLPLHALKRKPTSDSAIPLLRLAAPATFSRILQTLLRSATSILIPLRLQTSGLTAAEATSQLGMLNGMVMPILMLPGIFTSALSMVLLPRIAKAEEQPSEFRRLLRLSFFSSVPIAVFCAVAIYVFSPLLANTVYRQAELVTLFRLCAPQVILMTLNQLTASILSALGQQRRSMYIAGITATATLVLTWSFVGDPQLRINGVVLAHYASHSLSIILDFLAFLLWRRERRLKSGDKCV